MEKMCSCGGKLIECKISTGLSYLQTVSVPNGYNFPKNLNVKNYIYESCGRIYFYGVSAEQNQKEK